ncbi:MAG TPA: hypothetical protein VKA26_07740 [Ignavibacteriaceae bacterium]|nr:hypothetical protein [Ignavibacteriaceae bacterium]
MKKALFFLIIFCACISGQSKDPDKILDDIKKSYGEIKDYQVDVEIKIDVSFLKVPDTKAKIYFKQPDKTHIESKGFALLPKSALDISPTSLLKGKYTALFDHFEDYEGIPTAVVKTIPLGETKDIILTTFWVDQAKDILRKVEISTKTSGTFSINFKYDDKTKFQQLPSSIVFSFDVGKLNLPKKFSGGGNPDKADEKDYKPQIGRVYINYSNYIVNEGIPDSVFEKPVESLKHKKK